ncbi:hypothetical protein GCM10007879_09660 [Maritalea porphyrae]|uniref:Uncharacterized protein n=1 Tax=Maritalea porphyrae TaxID=880732 RepID=A0ABQ5URZ3_9HYPH|nr:hypothetical protein GCM10007879_09660 [Maritalea porphyrae]
MSETYDTKRGYVIELETQSNARARAIGRTSESVVSVEPSYYYPVSAETFTPLD